MEKYAEKTADESEASIQDLAALIGKWKTTGSAKTKSGKPEMAILGTDTYEWAAGESLILHKVDVMIGNERKESVEIIGFDSSTNTYPMVSFDKSARSTKMYAEFNHNLVKFLSETLRFTGSFSDDKRTISGIWEQFEKDEWIIFMEIKLSKS